MAIIIMRVKPLITYSEDHHNNKYTRAIKGAKVYTHGWHNWYSGACSNLDSSKTLIINLILKIPKLNEFDVNPLSFWVALAITIFGSFWNKSKTKVEQGHITCFHMALRVKS